MSYLPGMKMQQQPCGFGEIEEMPQATLTPMSPESQRQQECSEEPEWPCNEDSDCRQKETEKTMTQDDVRDSLLGDVSRIKQAIGRWSNRVAEHFEIGVRSHDRVNLTSDKRVTDLGILIREVRYFHWVNRNLQFRRVEILPKLAAVRLCPSQGC